MRALSFSQPWLWSVLYAGKRVENRSWAPPIDMIGTTIALHAAKSWDADALGFFYKLAIEYPGLYDLTAKAKRSRYPTSAILGVATIDRVVTEDRTLPADQKRWFFGAFGWILTDVRVLPVAPIPATGKLGLWTVGPDDDANIHEQLRKVA